MEIFSILDSQEVKVKDAPRDEFFTDLNLTQIIEEISSIWGRDVLGFYRYFPADKGAEEYRRAVLKDLLLPGVYETFYEAWKLIEDCKEAKEHGEKTKQSTPKCIWLVNEAAFFSDALKLVYKGIKESNFESEGMTTFRTMLNVYVESERFQKLSDTANMIRDSLANARFTLTYENSRVVLCEKSTISENTDEECSELAKALRRLDSNANYRIKSPFLENEDLVGMEYELVQLFMKKNPQVYKKAIEFYKEFREYGPAWIFRFFGELTFYLSFIKFEKHVNALGADLALPSEDEDRAIGACGLYDLALFIANKKRGKEVVSNDFSYEDKEQFFVLTGPNQGGKTTFARSLGQLVFFTKMGLMVPAKSANLHYFSSIVTHFSVEESVETGRGKLMEELVRLAPMMEHSGENSFVIINELFTTAANYDAVIMGKRVLSHFIKNGSHGIYVTHLTELIDFEEKAVGLCAALDAEGRQTFKIRKEIMEYSNCATNQVNKYGLTYEALKERLK